MKTASPRRRGADRRRRSYEQVVIEAVQPSLDGGRHPVKVVAGDTLVIEATVFRHGHDRVRAALHWSAPGEDGVRETPMTLINPGLDSRRSLVCIRKRDSCRVSRDHCASERLCGVLRAQQVLDMM